VLFLEQWLPLVVVTWARVPTSVEVSSLIAGFERILARDERCAVLSVSPPDAVPMGPGERKLLRDWLSEPRLRERAKRVCVGSAAVVASPVTRLVTTALLWVWTSPTPFRMYSTGEDAFRFCLVQLTAASVPLAQPAALTRHEVRVELERAGIPWSGDSSPKDPW
jgi:hypothetical protein